ncbi:hypothetical protein PJI17_32465, partial [Mycobacterium kansasii]
TLEVFGPPEFEISLIFWVLGECYGVYVMDGLDIIKTLQWAPQNVCRISLSFKALKWIFLLSYNSDCDNHLQS